MAIGGERFPPLISPVSPPSGKRQQALRQMQANQGKTTSDSIGSTHWATPCPPAPRALPDFASTLVTRRLAASNTQSIHTKRSTSATTAEKADIRRVAPSPNRWQAAIRPRSL